MFDADAAREELSVCMDDQTPSVPRVGMLACVRNRQGVVTAVEPFSGQDRGVLHLVTIEYVDGEGTAADRIIWEREVSSSLLEPNDPPRVSGTDSMPVAEFDALVRATRWSASQPFLDPDGDAGPLERMPVSAPFHGSIQWEDYQLVPLLKALRMPRVSLLLADDVGLGKTVEAGLIVAELVLRRRVRRILILCPPSLRTQWRDEMRDKFSLTFDIVDRTQTQALRKDLGLDANPWRTSPRTIASYHYLKQPDVLEEFRAACRVPEGTPRLPWDMLIVDEVHNLAPSVFGDDSDLSRMLRYIAPFFEHKLFLSATPHNGHTRCFSGLLETLDPLRFSQKSALTDAERERIPEVVVRRLKSEINAASSPPRFAERTPSAVPLKLHAAERSLSAAFQQFRDRLGRLMRSADRSEALAGTFAIEILGKRLLSCPFAFAESWRRYLAGMSAPDAASAAAVRASEAACRTETGNDPEAESRVAVAVHAVGAWLKPLAVHLAQEMEDVSSALTALDLNPEQSGPTMADPVADTRFDALTVWIRKNLLADGKKWRDDERLVVFTEYKTTLDYLDRRLRQLLPEPGRIRLLYGGMDDTERDVIKAAFNDPDNAVRVLLATDAAAEGLNLQSTARYLWHYDIPWNPARLEQRNGRLDRHGQARDVIVYHFTSDDDADLAFIAYVAGKVHQIREDLGSVGEVFDAAIQRRLVYGEDARTVQGDLDAAVTRSRHRADVPRDKRIEAARDGKTEAERLRALAAELDLSPQTLRSTLRVALRAHAVEPPDLEDAGAGGRVAIKGRIPVSWTAVVDDWLRLPMAGGVLGPLPYLTFDPATFIESVNGRPVFRPRRDTVLLHLSHPIYQRVLADFARARFPGSEFSTSRWTVRADPAVPSAWDAFILLTIEELAVNDLRETVHHWVQTLRFPVANGRLGAPLPHQPAASGHASAKARAGDPERARELWDHVELDLRDFLGDKAKSLTRDLAAALKTEEKAALKRENERFLSRQGEISKLIVETRMEKLEDDLAAIELEMKQGVLFDAEQRLGKLRASREEKEAELRRIQDHTGKLQDLLTRERERVIDRLIPARHTLRGTAQVFPVAVEIRLPGGAV